MSTRTLDEALFRAERLLGEAGDLVKLLKELDQQRQDPSHNPPPLPRQPAVDVPPKDAPAPITYGQWADRGASKDQKMLLRGVAKNAGITEQGLDAMVQRKTSKQRWGQMSNSELLMVMNAIESGERP